MTSLYEGWNELDLARHKAEFYRMWHAGHEAGLSPVAVFSTMGELDRSRTVRSLRDALLRGVQDRATVTETIRAHPELVAPHEAGLLELGEESGRLGEILQMLGDHYTAEHRHALWWKKKLAYPMVNVAAAMFVVPIPILLAGGVTWYLAVVAAELVGFAFAGGTLLTAVARRFRRRHRFVVSRLCRTLALTVEAGLSLDRVATLAALAAGDDGLIDHVDRTLRSGEDGSLADVFRDAAIVPRDVIAALDVATASGDVHLTLGKLADMYDEGSVGRR